MARQVLKGMKNAKGKEWNTPPKKMKNAQSKNKIAPKEQWNA